MMFSHELLIIIWCIYFWKIRWTCSNDWYCAVCLWYGGL